MSPGAVDFVISNDVSSLKGGLLMYESERNRHMVKNKAAPRYNVCCHFLKEKIQNNSSVPTGRRKLFRSDVHLECCEFSSTSVYCFM